MRVGLIGPPNPFQARAFEARRSREGLPRRTDPVYASRSRFPWRRVQSYILATERELAEDEKVFRDVRDRRDLFEDRGPHAEVATTRHCRNRKAQAVATL